VELVTEYLEGAMPPAMQAPFEAHLEGCGECMRYLEQMRHTMELVGRLREDDLSEGLLDALRGWR
jgi:hypothetical protein